MKTKQKGHGSAKRKRAGLLRPEESCRLLFGPYEPPLVRRGRLVDEVRGEVKFGAFSNALIPWPKAKRQGKHSGSGGFILCGDLVRALKRESNPAIAYHWGVSITTVVNWRQMLGLIDRKHRTEGAERLVKLGVELARLPESRRKIAEAARGRVLSKRHKSKLHGAMRAGWRERMNARRAAYRESGHFPKATKSDSWLPEEEALLSTLPTRDLVALLGRTSKAVQSRRYGLGIRCRAAQRTNPWTEGEIKLLGTVPDKELAVRLKRSFFAVEQKRRKLGIPALTDWRPWTPEEEAVLGKISDAEAAGKFGRTEKAVQHHRLKLGLAFGDAGRPWTAEEKAWLGTDSDKAVAKRLGRSRPSVSTKRRALGIPKMGMRHDWTPEDIAILGTMSDVEAARKLNLSVSAVSNKRSKLGIGAGFNRRWTPEEDKLLGTMSDQSLAVKIGKEVNVVAGRRRKLHVAMFQGDRDM